MIYLLKEDVLLRARSREEDRLEVFYDNVQQWRPYGYRRRDLEFVKTLTSREAVQHLIEMGLSREAATAAVT